MRRDYKLCALVDESIPSIHGSVDFDETPKPSTMDTSV